LPPEVVRLPAQDLPWRPLSPAAVFALFDGVAFPWWIAGGYAIERAVGRALREHGDIDVLVFHRDQAAIRAHLKDWDCWMADPPGSLRPWPVGEDLPASVHDVWCRSTPDDPWALQLMVDRAKDGQWVSRRDPWVGRPVAELGDDHWLVPEVPLFYKAKEPRPRDHQDFNEVLSLLTSDQCQWLGDAIRAAYGVGNGWLDCLERFSLFRDALPPELFARMQVLVRDCAWPVSAIPAVIEACRGAGLINLGGDLQVKGPRGRWESPHVGVWIFEPEFSAPDPDAQVEAAARAALRKFTSVSAEDMWAGASQYPFLEELSDPLEDHLLFSWVARRPTTGSLVRKSSDLRTMMPRDKLDTEKAAAVVALGYPAVEPVIEEMLQWMQDINWPVAQIFQPFLATIGAPLVPYIRTIFETDDHIWKLWVLEGVIGPSADLRAIFHPEIERFASAPTSDEQAEGLDEVAQNVLALGRP